MGGELAALLTDPLTSKMAIEKPDTGQLKEAIDVEFAHLEGL